MPIIHEISTPEYQYNRPQILERADELFTESGVQCDCGWGAYGHKEHEPRCATEAVWFDSLEQAEQEHYENYEFLVSDMDLEAEGAMWDRHYYNTVVEPN